MSVPDKQSIARSDAVGVVIAVPDEDAAIAAMLAGDADRLHVLAMVQEAGALTEVLTHVQPRVVFLHHRLPGMWDQMFAHTVSELAGGAPVVLLADAASRTEPDLLAPHKGPFPPAVYAEATRAGAATVAPWPPAPGEWGPLVRTLVQRRQPALTHPATRGTVLGLRCDSGHTGVSELAINIAGLLAARPTRPDGLRILLADLDLMRGDLHLLLRLSPSATAGLDGLWRAASGLIASGRPDALAEHAPVTAFVTPYPRPQDTAWDGAARIDVLSAMLNRNDAYDFAGEQPSGADETHPAVTLLRAWQSVYDVVILDLGAEQSPAQLALAAACDTLLVVTTPEYAAVQADALGHTRLLRATGLAPERCRLVLNMWDDLASQYSMVEAARSFREPIQLAGAVDYDRALVRPARWAGYPIPALVSGPAGLPQPFGTQVEELVKTLLPGLLATRTVRPAERVVAALQGARASLSARAARLLGGTMSGGSEPTGPAASTPDGPLLIGGSDVEPRETAR